MLNSRNKTKVHFFPRESSPGESRFHCSIIQHARYKRLALEEIHRGSLTLALILTLIDPRWIASSIRHCKRGHTKPVLFLISGLRL